MNFRSRGNKSDCFDMTERIISMYIQVRRMLGLFSELHNYKILCITLSNQRLCFFFNRVMLIMMDVWTMENL